MTIVPALIGSFIVLAVIALGLWYFERMLAKRPSKYAGIGMPAAFLVLSLFHRQVDSLCCGNDAGTGIRRNRHDCHSDSFFSCD